MLRRASHSLPAGILALLLLGATAAIGEEGGRPEIGSMAPDFTLETSSGTSHSLSQLRGQKNALVVFFRGTW